nr:MAG TPA: YopX protein [Caudoviricetes sp.]
MRMREIKFRIWVKDRKAIFEVISIDYVTKKVTYLLERVGHLLSIRDAKFNDVELMQYTGIKDMRGKEIYEGDIVIQNNKRHRVIFDEENARFCIRDDEFELNVGFTNNNNERMEVVGNIYENSELTEGE